MKNKLKLHFKFPFLFFPTLLFMSFVFSQEKSNDTFSNPALNVVDFEYVETIVKFKTPLTIEEIKLVIDHYYEVTIQRKFYYDEKNQSLHVIYDVNKKEIVLNDLNTFFSSNKILIESLTSIIYDNNI